MKIFVVIGDPDYYRHYDSVHKSLEEAMSYIIESEKMDKVGSSHIYGQEFFDKGRWTNEDGEQCWGYPGYGNTHGIVVEDLDL